MVLIVLDNTGPVGDDLQLTIHALLKANQEKVPAAMPWTSNPS
jgi:hypothetical protein